MAETLEAMKAASKWMCSMSQPLPTPPSTPEMP